MLHVELPHVNVLSKMDLIELYGKLGKLGAAGLTSDKPNVTTHETEVNLIFLCKPLNFHTMVTYLLSCLVFLYSLQP